MLLITGHNGQSFEEAIMSDNYEMHPIVEIRSHPTDNLCLLKTTFISFSPITDIACLPEQNVTPTGNASCYTAGFGPYKRNQDFDKDAVFC